MGEAVGLQGGRLSVTKVYRGAVVLPVLDVHGCRDVEVQVIGFSFQCSWLQRRFNSCRHCRPDKAFSSV